MRRVLLYGIGWLAAATAAVLLAWQGVGRVGTNVTDRHAAPLTAEQARQQLERTTATGTGAEPGQEPGGGPATTVPGSGGGGGGPATAPTPTTSPRAATTSTVPGSPTSTPSTTEPGSSATSTSTAPPTGATETRTYNLVGGSATLRFSPSGVTVVLAEPKPGFSADIDEGSGGRVRVRFEGPSHRSQVEAWWDGGPRDEVREEGDEDGRGSGRN